MVGLEHTEGIMTAGEQLIERGIKVGLEKGQQRLLVKLLCSRFGVLPDATLARIHTADSTRLDTWFDRALTASSLDAVFDGA
jgi:hypothetical protein